MALILFVDIFSTWLLQKELRKDTLWASSRQWYSRCYIYVYVSTYILTQGLYTKQWNFGHWLVRFIICIFQLQLDVIFSISLKQLIHQVKESVTIIMLFLVIRSLSAFRWSLRTVNSSDQTYLDFFIGIAKEKDHL